MNSAHDMEIMISAIDEAMDKKYVSIDTAKDMRSFCESADLTDNDDREVLQEIRNTLLGCLKCDTAQEHSNIDEVSVIEEICESAKNGKISADEQKELLDILENA